jgi:hypothetical protein
VRWDRLFEDLENEADALRRDVLEGDLVEGTRHEWARLSLLDRLRGSVGAEVACHVRGGGVRRGSVREVGADWLLLDCGPRRWDLLPAAALVGVEGLGARSGDPAGRPALLLTAVLRGLARDRAPVVVHLVDGVPVAGTVDRVGADHLDLALHPPDVPRLRHEVRGTRTVPIPAVAAVESPPGR